MRQAMLAADLRPDATAPMPCSRRKLLTFLGLAIAATTTARAQQDLGHKVLGGVGIDAGVQSPPGLFIAARVLRFSSTTLRDRSGGRVPLAGLDIDARGATVGLGYTLKRKRGPYLSFAAAAPIADVSLSVDDPRVSVDRSGLSDLFIQPLRLGGRWTRFDAVAAYALYAPTGKFEPRGRSGVGRGFWTQQLSVGGAAFFSKDRQRRASALLSYDINSRKRGIDIRRGNTLQIQGGAGVGVGRGSRGTVGIAGYALWQVTDDVGSAIPPALRGLRERVFGLGPELQVILPKARLRAEARILFDFGVRSRPQGNVAVGGLTYQIKG